MRTFDSDNLPEGFPSDGIQNIQGKRYITHVGLVWLANHRGKPWSSTIDNIERMYGDDGWPFYVEVTVTITDGECSHTALGDATRSNVGRNIVPHFVRMAHTRAMNRALRAFVGYAGCTSDELGFNDEPIEAKPARSSKQDHASDSQQVASVSAPVVDNGDRNRSIREARNGDPSCPHCGAMVYDNRETAKGSQPLFVCSAKDRCAGAKRKGDRVYGWSSWDPDWWDKQKRQTDAVEEDNRKVGEPAARGLIDEVADSIGSAYRDVRDERGEPFYDEDLPF